MGPILKRKSFLALSLLNITTSEQQIKVRYNKDFIVEEVLSSLT